RFQAGYVVVFPMRQFIGAGHHLDVTLRVTPDGAPPSYLTQALDLPEVPQATKADGVVAGSILVGEGSYRIDALIEDDQQRVCRADWRMRARQARAERNLTPLMPPNAVASLSSAIPAAPRTGDVRTIGRLTVLLHAAPLRARNAVLQPGDVQMLTGSLAALLERLPARSVRVVAFNLDQQKELLRRDNFAASDIESVTRAVNDLPLPTIGYGVLAAPRGGVAMLGSMVDAELGDADPVIVLGPEGRVRVPLPASLPERPFTARLFYFDYQRRTGFASSPLPPIGPN